MIGVEPYWILSEVLLLITSILLIVTYLLLPTKKDIQAGIKKLPGWVPYLHGAMFISAGAIIIISLMLVEKNLIIMITGGLLIVALVLAFIDYFVTKGHVKKAASGGTIHHAVELSDHPADQHPDHGQISQEHHHQAPNAPGSQPAMMTVECPQCGGHLHMPEGSHQITCPYCGLSGTI